MAVTRRGRGRQPVDIRLSVMAVTRRGLPLENVKGVRKRWRKEKNCGNRNPRTKGNLIERIVLAGKTLGRPPQHIGIHTV
ncbi:UNVERIFIED_CONTAM: hypothetical protein FKN15_036578 [Acipenser sinensis]